MTTETDWKKIAIELAQRVNFAVTHLKGGGSALLDPETGALRGWRDYMVEGMEMIPGVKVDREVLATLDMPLAKRRAAQKAIKNRREQEKAQ